MKIILNGKLDEVIALRKAKQSWTVRAWGITYKDLFFGLVIFHRLSIND